MKQERAQYQAEYLKKNQRQFMVKVNRKLDPEMVDWLESKESVQTYIKELIREDMKRNGKLTRT